MVYADAFDDVAVAFERGDYATALRLLRPLAEQGFAHAQAGLGIIYYNGKGVPQNHAEAAKWYRKAAEQGHADAQINLGLMYDLGEGVPQDDAEAVKWYCKAAEHGDVDAQINLGGMYANGDGVRQDYVSAYMWFTLGAAQGQENAPKGLDIVGNKMTSDQIAEALRMACEWMAKHQQQRLRLVPAINAR